MNTTRIPTLFAAMAFLLLALPMQVAMAHGVDITTAPQQGTEVVATFDTGEPMAGAQVAVFTPEDPADPWLTGITDENGKFIFVPDANLPGTWEVRVRQAGHGDFVRIEVEPDGVVEAAESSLSGPQKALMALSVAWGSAGTALYFFRRRVA